MMGGFCGDKINVGLYGGPSLFSKTTPLSAKVTYCTRHDECGLFSKGYCLAVPNVFRGGCPYGTTETIKGYTARAQKFSAFRRKYKEDEKYSALKNPSETIVALVVDLVYISLGCVDVDKEGKVSQANSFMAGGESFVPVEKFTVDLVERICKYVPRTLFENAPIKSYREERIPKFISGLSEDFPDIYAEFMDKFPEYATTQSNVGRKALLSTVVKGSTVTINKNHYEWDGEALTGKPKSGLSLLLPFDLNAKGIDVTIKPEDGWFVEITDDSQVDANTIFKM